MHCVQSGTFRSCTDWPQAANGPKIVATHALDSEDAPITAAIRVVSRRRRSIEAGRLPMPQLAGTFSGQRAAGQLLHQFIMQSDKAGAICHFNCTKCNGRKDDMHSRARSRVNNDTLTAREPELLAMISHGTANTCTLRLTCLSLNVTYKQRQTPTCNLRPLQY